MNETFSKLQDLFEQKNNKLNNNVTHLIDTVLNPYKKENDNLVNSMLTS